MSLNLRDPVAKKNANNSRKNSEQIAGGVKDGKKRERGLASTEPSGGVVAAHEGHAIGLDSTADEVHQVSESQKFHRSLQCLHLSDQVS